MTLFRTTASRTVRWLTAALGTVAGVGIGGCSGKNEPSAATGSSPSLNAPDPAERVEAAREAAKKYGTKP